MCVFKQSDQDPLRAIQKTTGTIKFPASRELLIIAMTEEPLDRSVLQEPPAALGEIPASDLAFFRPFLLQPPQILSHITVRWLFFLFRHMCKRHVSCLVSGRQAGKGLVYVMRAAPLPLRQGRGAGFCAEELSAFQTEGLLLLIASTRSSILLMKTVSWKHCPLLSGHSLKPLFCFPSHTYTFQSNISHASLSLCYGSLPCKQTKPPFSWEILFL